MILATFALVSQFFAPDPAAMYMTEQHSSVAGELRETVVQGPGIGPEFGLGSLSWLSCLPCMECMYTWGIMSPGDASLGTQYVQLVPSGDTTTSTEYQGSVVPVGSLNWRSLCW